MRSLFLNHSPTKNRQGMIAVSSPIWGHFLGQSPSPVAYAFLQTLGSQNAFRGNFLVFCVSLIRQVKLPLPV